ncbi:MAG: trigger factor [Armatimonadota bacterium]
MKVDLKEGKDNKINLTIEVEADKIKQAYEKELIKATKQIKLKGFRQGKAPAKIVEKAVSKESIYKELLEDLIPETYSEAIYMKEITPISQPEFKEIGKIEEDKPFIYKLSVEVKPKIDLENYTGFEIEQEKREISDETINKQLELLRKQFSKMTVIEEDRPVQDGDYVSCDYTINVEGEKEDPRNAAKEALVRIVPNPDYPGLIENIIGTKSGEEKEFPIEIKAGEKTKKATVKFKLHEIKQEVLPEINDDFAKTVSGAYAKSGSNLTAETLDGLKSQIKENMQKNEDSKVKQELETKILDKIAESNKIDISKNMVNYELGVLLNDFESQLSRNGMNLENYLKTIKKSWEDLEKDLRPQAEKMAKIELALDSIAEKEKIEITDEDLEKELEEVAETMKQDKDKIKETLEKNKNLKNFKYNLLRKKVINYLTEKSKIKYTAPKTEEQGS